MRASVRIVMAALAALLAAVVWLGRDRQETLDSKANASESIVHTKSAPASNANRTQTAQFASHADSEHETRVTPSPEEPETSSSVPAQGAQPPLLTSAATATAHKVLMPQTASAEEDAEGSE